MAERAPQERHAIVLASRERARHDMPSARARDRRAENSFALGNIAVQSGMDPLDPVNLSGRRPHQIA